MDVRKPDCDQHISLSVQHYLVRIVFCSWSFHTSETGKTTKTGCAFFFYWLEKDVFLHYYAIQCKVYCLQVGTILCSLGEYIQKSSARGNINGIELRTGEEVSWKCCAIPCRVSDSEIRTRGCTHRESTISSLFWPQIWAVLGQKEWTGILSMSFVQR